ncbi:glucose-1-phosphate thymidylyltransferase [Paenibacillus cellulosilyticus]|uniref:Glucose-1-phosphate thymidylyltransferase n=1 Tax=Paenibacillus cellulosilyticus TaxID=375489 RepID=A0A2V2YRT5_9BACL|nr:sugar phosphate nucleotidyltransferase [Paenibacillus cellulosilyticus]PWV99325.1 glucose-1-phosphate thymidylyltransferase [Paenibacillus cellulosilyticus]QKS45090.1 NTP transferase domain-containing protein [Paenibacillus cellulosilyticus]
MKGLILCAGKGSRLYPFTYNRPKTLVPVANTPLLQLSIVKLMELGIDEVGIVIHPSQETSIREKFGEGQALGISISYIYQHESKGIAHAVKQAQAYISDEPFLLLLGDNLISASLSRLKNDVELNEAQASLLLAEVEVAQDYGIAEIQDERIVGIEEKPVNPKSQLAVLGAYAFTKDIFNAIDEIRPSKRGEYEITDAIQRLIDQQKIVSYHVTDQLNIDVGTMDRWLKANQKLLSSDVSMNRMHSSVRLENCTIVEPVSIDKDCVLKDCQIGPYVSIGEGSKLENCQIENSIILNGVYSKDLPFLLKNVIIGDHSIITSVQTDEGVNEP